MIDGTRTYAHERNGAECADTQRAASTLAYPCPLVFGDSRAESVSVCSVCGRSSGLASASGPEPCDDCPRPTARSVQQRAAAYRIQFGRKVCFNWIHNLMCPRVSGTVVWPGCIIYFPPARRARGPHGGVQSDQSMEHRSLLLRRRDHSACL